MINHHLKLRLGALVLLIAAALTVSAQIHHSSWSYDGEHKNEAWAIGQYGSNTVTGKFFDITLNYKHHFTPRWSLGGAFDGAIGKGRFGFYTQGGYRLPVRNSSLHILGKVMYNRYTGFHTNEEVINLSAMWEHPYFDITLGESWIHYNLVGDGYTEPLTLTFGAAVNIRPRTNSWNLGVFARNYDEFYYENWEINWGFHFNAKLTQNTRLFGELNVRPAGSMSQLATKYETSLKLGVKYGWK